MVAITRPRLGAGLLCCFSTAMQADARVTAIALPSLFLLAPSSQRLFYQQKQEDPNTHNELFLHTNK
jgi:hypothetical protein